MLETPTAHSETAGGSARWRRAKRLGVAASVIAFLGLGWAGWRWYTTPSVPDVNLTDVEAAVAEAVNEALDVVRQKPRSGEAWGQLGMVLLANSFYAPAEASFVQAQRFEPDNPAWHYLLAVRLLMADREAGLGMLRRAVELCARHDPKNTAPRLLFAEALIEKADLEAAEAECRKVIEQQPDNPRALYDLGLIAYARDDLDQSIVFLSRSSVSPFAWKKSALQLAAIHQRRGDLQKAKEFAKQAEMLPGDKTWPDPYIEAYRRYARGRLSRYLDAEALEQQDRLKEGTRILWELAADSPDDNALNALGTALAKLGDNDNAEKILRKALQQAPGKISSNYALCVALYNQGETLRRHKTEARAQKKYEEAAMFARKTIALKVEHAWAHCYLGLSLWQLGDKMSALAEFDMAVKLRPELPDLHLRLGQALAGMGRTKEAVVHLETAVTLDAQNQPRFREALDKVRSPSKEKNQ